MKIICIDNFARETVDDILIAENVAKGYAGRIADLLNKDEPSNSIHFYKVVNDKYKLYKWKP